MSTPDRVAVRRFQNNSLGEVFRQAADWLDEPRRETVIIESINHVQLPRAPGGTELLSIFFTTTSQGRIADAPVTPGPTWNTVTRAIFDDLGVQYAPTGRQLTGRHIEAGQWILLSHAVQMVKAIVHGPYQAIDPPKTPDLVPDSVDIPRLHKAAVSWFREIIEHLGAPHALADKALVLRTIAPRVALASLGSAFYSGDEEAIASARAALADIDWTVSFAWQGIGGQVVEGETGLSMVSGSGKGSIGRAMQALKPDTDIGRAVRKQR